LSLGSISEPNALAQLALHAEEIVADLHGHEGKQVSAAGWSFVNAALLVASWCLSLHYCQSICSIIDVEEDVSIGIH